MHLPKDKTIEKICEIFYRLGLWRKVDDNATITSPLLKFLVTIHYLLFPISLLAGAIASKFQSERIFLANSAICSFVLWFKLLYLIWKNEEIYKFLDTISAHDIEDHAKFDSIQRKLKNWSHAFSALSYTIYFFAASSLVVVPFIGNEKKLFFNIGFPLDYKNDATSYWLAYAFIFTQVVLCAISFVFSLLVWYLLLNCSVKYEILGSNLRNMGATGNSDNQTKKVKNSRVEKQKMFRRDLIAGIESHRNINKSTGALMSFLNRILSIQFTIGAISICCSIYCLAFINAENLVELAIFAGILLYNFSETLMVMHFGNEIKLKSTELSYCLFQSSWIEQTQFCKKLFIIFGERLKQPQEIHVLQLYPLTLQTFQRVLKSAYTMFNVLQNMN